MGAAIRRGTESCGVLAILNYQVWVLATQLCSLAKINQNYTFKFMLFSIYILSLIKNIFFWTRTFENRQIYQWKGIMSPEINPKFHCQLIFYKEDKTIKWNKE